MKKILLLVIAATYSVFSNAQSQRLVLVEEFTGENCDPCALYNPAFNALLKVNTSKIVALKYQCNIPSPGPVLYAQTKTDVDVRQSYYKVPSAPWCTMDGTLFNGNVASFKQLNINAESSVTSPFDILLTHSISPNYDSVYITMIVKASEDIASSKHYRAHIVLVEKEITFSFSPGSNGEKDYNMVMRKMYPDAKGSAIDTSWLDGEADTINIAAPIPSFYYNISKLCVVGFVQDSVNKSIKQAAFSQPLPVGLDASVTGVAAPMINCTGTFLPSVYLKNKGKAKLDSCILSYSLDNATPVEKIWKGEIDSGKSKTITLDEIQTTPGKHTLAVTCSNPNGMVDWTGDNSNYAITNIVGTYTPAPVYEQFISTTFPPANWFINDQERDGKKWIRKTGVGGLGYTSSCAGLPLYSYPAGAIDELYMIPLSLSGVTEQYLTFNWAYCQIYGYEKDDLSIQVSTDCGANWDIIWDRGGVDLTTSAPDPNGYVFVPKGNQWSSGSVDLKKYVGISEVFIKFRVLSDNGNYLYLDDINVSTSPVGVNEVEGSASGVKVYPSPASTLGNIELSLSKNADVKITVTNLLGEIVYSDLKNNMTAGNHHLTLDVSKFSSGIYNVNVTTGTDLSSKKMVIIK